MKYSPRGIDQMRVLLARLDSGSGSDEDKDRRIERRLLTHIANGTTVLELEAEDLRVNGTGVTWCRSACQSDTPIGSAFRGWADGRGPTL